MIRNTGFILFVAILIAVPAISGQKATDQSAGAEHPDKATKTIHGVNSTAEPPKSNRPIKAPGSSAQQFLKEAAIGDIFEIQMGQLAQQKGSSPAVKAFAKRMIKDHSQNDDEVKSLAQTEHVPLQSVLDPKHKAQKQQLAGKSGADFDKDYANLMVRDHERTVKNFKHEASAEVDPTIKKYAQGTLPVLESHLSDAKTMAAQVSSPSQAKGGGNPAVKKDEQKK